MPDLHKSQIDGLLSEPGTTDMHWALDYLRLGRALGINPRYTGSFAMGGATAGALIQLAAMAVTTGMANYVACCFGDAAKTGRSGRTRPAGGYLGVGDREQRGLGRVRRGDVERDHGEPAHGALRHDRPSRWARSRSPRAGTRHSIRTRSCARRSRSRTTRRRD